MKNISESYPECTKLESLVQTEGGKDIWALSITIKWIVEGGDKYTINVDSHKGRRFSIEYP